LLNSTSPPHHRHITATSPPHHRHITATSPPHHRHITATACDGRRLHKIMSIKSTKIKKKPRKFAIKRSNDEWAAYLKPEQYDVLRKGSLAKPWRGEYLNFFPFDGVFACRGCGAILYASDRKFDDASGYCAFDQCFQGRLYCSRTDVSTGVKVWIANCSGCGSNIARVTRGEQRTNTNERHVVSSHSIKYLPGNQLVGTIFPNQGPLQTSLDAETNQYNVKESLTAAPPSAELSETESSRGKRGYEERPCDHMLKILKKMRVYQSLAKVPYDRGHQTCNGTGDIAGTVNLPCSESDEKDIPGVKIGYEGCKDCLRNHTPMHRCSRFDTWLCLYPGCRSACKCSRYSKKHYISAPEHCVYLTPGLGIRCFTCNRFVYDPRCDRLLRQAHLSRFGNLPLKGDPPAELKNGAAILRHKLGYQNAQACACSLCNPAEEPHSKLPCYVRIPNQPDPPHPSYIQIPVKGIGGSSGSSSSGASKNLLDRIKGMIVGAALGDALGQITSGMSREISVVTFGDLVKSKRLNFQHVNLRHKRRSLPSKGHKIGEWTTATDLMIVGLQSLLAFGGRLEVGDVALRLARYVEEGLTVDYHERGEKIGSFVKRSNVTPLVSRVIGDNIDDFVKKPSQLAFEAEQAYSANPMMTSGNEAIFRSFIFATRKFDDVDTVVKTVRTACRMTHASTRAVASAIALGSSISMMLNGQYSWNSGGDSRCKLMQRDSLFVACRDEAMNKFQREYRSTLLFGVADPPKRMGDEEWSDEEEYVEYIKCKDNLNGEKCDDELLELEGVVVAKQEAIEETVKEMEIAQIGLDCLGLDDVLDSSQALKTAAVAFWAQRYPNSEYMDPLLEVILQGGDASANGCICGAIMGLRCGFSKLPIHWLSQLRGKDWLCGLADKYSILLWGGH
jgi:peptide-methionine (R)-S-oxide reductase